MNELKKKKDTLRSEILNFLDSIGKMREYLAPYSIRSREHARYEFQLEPLYELLEQHNLFKDVTNINSKKYSEILASDDLNDNEVEKLLNMRKLTSITRSLTVICYGKN